jgi:hypothetical protein
MSMPGFDEPTEEETRATIEIANSDSGQSPYTFTVSGTGVLGPTPTPTPSSKSYLLWTK